MIPGASLAGIGLVVGLAVLTFPVVRWLDRKAAEAEISKREISNARNRAFYGAIGEKWYPHRNADGTTSHFPTRHGSDAP